MSVPVAKTLKVIEVTTVNTGAAYSAGDQIGVANRLVGALNSDSGKAVLDSLTIVDIAGQTTELDIFVFDSAPTLVGADNDAFSVLDADMQATCLGVLNFASGTGVWKSYTGGTLATIKDQKLVVKNAQGKAISAFPSTARD